MAKNMTTIQISKETKGRLDSIGRRGETYNNIVCRLLSLHDRNKKAIK